MRGLPRPAGGLPDVITGAPRGPLIEVAIPVYNEERHVERVLDEVRRYSPHVLVVNDGSTDATGELLARQKGIDVITHPKNSRYGAALISAFAHALASIR